MEPFVLSSRPSDAGMLSPWIAKLSTLHPQAADGVLQITSGRLTISEVAVAFPDTSCFIPV